MRAADKPTFRIYTKIRGYPFGYPLLLYLFSIFALIQHRAVRRLSDADETAFHIVSQLRAIRRAVCRHMLCNLLSHFGGCDFRQAALQHTLVLHGQIDRNKTIRYAAILISIDLEQQFSEKRRSALKPMKLPFLSLARLECRSDGRLSAP